MVRRPPNTLCVSAIDFAALHHAPLQVMFCWQLKDLGVVKGYENAVAPISVGQAQAERMLDELLDSVQVSSANIPDDFQIESHAFHIPASKGLIAASRYARHLVVGSRGLSVWTRISLDRFPSKSSTSQTAPSPSCTTA